MDKFLFLTHENHDAYFNLASEEYLLKIKGGYFFYLWRNAPAVIIGVNQNAFSEVNFSYTNSHGIKVVRRMTGGGAVYHDLENINYTVIASHDETVDNYKKFTAPVIEYLRTLGVNAEFSGRNDITVDGKKISGNAQTVYDGRIMHHGTLLFNTDMSVLSDALKPNKLKIESKGIKSVRARVTNIYDCLPVKMSADEFLRGLCDFFKKDKEEYVLTENDVSAIEKLKNEKYSKYEWNVGRSPVGKNKVERRFPFGIVAVNFDTKNGVIKNAEITGDFFSLLPIHGLESRLDGVRFNKESLTEAFKPAGCFIKGAIGEMLADMIIGE